MGCVGSTDVNKEDKCTKALTTDVLVRRVVHSKYLKLIDAYVPNPGHLALLRKDQCNHQWKYFGNQYHRSYRCTRCRIKHVYKHFEHGPVDAPLYLFHSSERDCSARFFCPSTNTFFRIDLLHPHREQRTPVLSSIIFNASSCYTFAPGEEDKAIQVLRESFWSTLAAYVHRESAPTTT